MKSHRKGNAFSLGFDEKSYDETNIIIPAVARKNKCESIIIVNNSEYNKLKDVLGISKVVDPRKITVSKILKHIHKGKIESVFAIDNNQAEIIHAQVLKSSKLINKNINQYINHRL